VLPSVDINTVAAYIKAARDRGLSFSYLLNAPCWKSRADARGQERLLEFVGRLAEIGSTRVGLEPGAGALIRRQLPGTRRPWQCAQLATTCATEIPGVLGVDPLILPYSEFNRDFGALERILAHLSCGIVLFANISCIYHCSYLAEHATTSGTPPRRNRAAATTGHDRFLPLAVHPPAAAHPELLLMSRWIRPEDLHVYEALGVEEFKIIDRSAIDSLVLRATKAYASRRYDGNFSTPFSSSCWAILSDSIPSSKSRAARA